MAWGHMSDKIKQYWDERAAAFITDPAATTDDVFLRELEIATLVKTLRRLGPAPGACVLDVGCGNGYSTVHVARAMPELIFLGVDFSERMIMAAERLRIASPDVSDRVTFKVANVLELRGAIGEQAFPFVTTDRCLINLDTHEKQALALAEIAACTLPGGHYIAIENFAEGQLAMNEARRAVGLDDIPVRWHNLYFTESEFRRVAERFFESIEFDDFASSYYFATRVVYAGMCKMRGETPDYRHEIHRLAVRLPEAGRFSPIRMSVMRRRRADFENDTVA